MALEGIEKLIKLERLSIKCSSVKSLSMEWGALHQLKSLKLHCSELEFRQCQLPSSLESLDLEVKKWGQLPINLSSLKNLTELKLSNFVIEEANSVEGLEYLEDLKLSYCVLKFDDFPVLKRLRILRLYKCRSHERASAIGSEFQIKISNLNNLSKLELFSVSKHSKFELSNLKNLSRLHLYYSSIHDGGFKVEGLESLVDLQMYDCIIYEFGNVSVLKSLTSLRIEWCSFPTMTCLHIPPQLDRLVELHIHSCSDIVDIHGIGKLKSLTKLWISECGSLRRIEDLSMLNGLAKITIEKCRAFEGIDGVDRLLSTGTLCEVDINRCKCKSVFYSSNLKYFQ